MKKFILFSFSVLAFILMAKNLEATDCWDNQGPCGPWTQSDYDYIDPQFPNCPLTVYYEWQLCGGQINLKLDALSLSDDPICDLLRDWLIPNGDYSNAHPERLEDEWRRAFEEIWPIIFMEQYQQALLNHQMDPNDIEYKKFECDHDGDIIIRTVTPGACLSWYTLVKWDVVNNVLLTRVVPVPCDIESC